jgi:hypothetical protein
LGTGAVLVGPSENDTPVDHILISVPAGNNAVGLLLNSALSDFTATAGQVRVVFLDIDTQVVADEIVPSVAGVWAFRGVTSSADIATVRVFGQASAASLFVRPLMDNFAWGTFAAVAIPEPGALSLLLGGILAIAIKPSK